MECVIEVLEPFEALRTRPRRPVMAKPKPKRVCALDGCGTILNSWNKTRYCHLHEAYAEQDVPVSAPGPLRGKYGRTVTEEMAQEFYERWKAGESPDSIAERSGVYRTTVSRYIRLQMACDPAHKGPITVRRRPAARKEEDKTYT